MRIDIETKAKLHIQKLITENKLELVISYILELENRDNPYIARKTAVEDFFKYAVVSIEESRKLLEIASDIKKTGLKTKDSLHIASAIIAEADYFLSTDDRLLKYQDSRIIVMNPVNFILYKEETVNE